MVFYEISELQTDFIETLDDTPTPELFGTRVSGHDKSRVAAFGYDNQSSHVCGDPGWAVLIWHLSLQAPARRESDQGKAQLPPLLGNYLPG